MLARSDFDVGAALELLGRHGIEAALLVPTPTGLQKSILDATGSVRDYLEDVGYHDFGSQEQGGEHKVQRDAFFVTPAALEPSTVSLYRPNSKSGDPRIWLGRATPQNAASFNLLALTVQRGELYILNMSDAGVRQSLEEPTSPFRRIVDAGRANPAATELLDMLRQVSSQGYVGTLRPGDTGVGMTLETLLGIKANANRDPDFKGIEIKAKRYRVAGRANRSTLFSKVPTWKFSPVGSALGLLEKRGYRDEDGRLQLYHTLRGNRRNSLGLRLEIDGERDWLMQVYEADKESNYEHDVTWELPKLRSDLAAKHQETFWVKALCRGAGEAEQFHYVEVSHTRAPLVRNFASLIEAGVITVDYALHLQGARARDHGYLFKIHPDNMGALFPPPLVYALA